MDINKNITDISNKFKEAVIYITHYTPFQRSLSYKEPQTLPKPKGTNPINDLEQLELMVEFFEYVETNKPEKYDDLEDCLLAFMEGKMND